MRISLGNTQGVDPAFGGGRQHWPEGVLAADIVDLKVEPTDNKNPASVGQNLIVSVRSAEPGFEGIVKDLYYPIPNTPQNGMDDKVLNTIKFFKGKIIALMLSAGLTAKKEDLQRENLELDTDWLRGKRIYVRVTHKVGDQVINQQTGQPSRDERGNIRYHLNDDVTAILAEDYRQGMKPRAGVLSVAQQQIAAGTVAAAASGPAPTLPGAPAFQPAAPAGAAPTGGFQPSAPAGTTGFQPGQNGAVQPPPAFTPGGAQQFSRPPV